MQSTQTIFNTFWNNQQTRVDTFKLTTILNNTYNMENTIGTSK